MKSIKIEETDITEHQLRFTGKMRKLNYKDLIEYALDVVPKGGFTPQDIKSRTRIQEALNKSKSKEILVEDADFEALELIMKNSRWPVRDKKLNTLLQNFETGFYNPKEV